MANICKTTITIIGLQEAPETFVKALSKVMFVIDLDAMDATKWGEKRSVDGKTWYSILTDEFRREGACAARYCVLYPHAPYNRLGITAPRYYVETKWEPPVDEIRKASKAFPELTFHLDWWLMEDGPVGEFVIRNGKIVESIQRNGSCYLFDWDVCYPLLSLLPAHLPYTLAQRGALRVEDAIQTIEGLCRVLADDRFKNSPYTPFSECRDSEKTEKLQAGLAALHDSLVAQAKRLDFMGVFLEERELTERYARVVEADEALMQSLGVEPLFPVHGKAVRFAILPFAVASISANCRAIVPVLHYLNADPVSGTYKKQPDGSAPPIEWEIRYLCLTRTDIMRIKNLLYDDQTPFDIDIILALSACGIGKEFLRVSNQARWKKDPELAKEVELMAAEMSDAFAAKLAGRPGMTILDDFQAVETTQGGREHTATDVWQCAEESDAGRTGLERSENRCMLGDGARSTSDFSAGAATEG